MCDVAASWQRALAKGDNGVGSGFLPGHGKGGGGK
jgi:hypothetical protein